MAEKDTKIKPFNEGASSEVIYGAAPEVQHYKIKWEVSKPKPENDCAEDCEVVYESDYEEDLLFGAKLSGLNHGLTARGKPVDEADDNISDITGLY